MIRKLFFGFFAFLYPTLLISGVLSVGLALVFATPNGLKGALDKSGIYHKVVDSALTNLTKNTELNDIPLSDPGVQTVIKQTLPPEYIENTTEGLIDSFYSWFNGQTKTPEFNLDLTKVKTDLANNLATYGSQRLATLPACPKGTPVDDVDPLSAACVPAGFNTAAATDQIRGNILSSTDFFKDTNVSLDTIKDENGQPALQKFNAVPTAFKAFVYSAWITFGLAVLCAVVMIFLASTKRKGMRTVGILSTVCGVLLIVIAWGAGFAADKFATSIATQSGADILKVNVMQIAQVLLNEICKWWLWFGVGLTASGIGLIVGQHFMGPRTPKDKKSGDDDDHHGKIAPYLDDETGPIPPAPFKAASSKAEPKIEPATEPPMGPEQKPEPKPKTVKSTKSSKKISVSG